MNDSLAYPAEVSQSSSAAPKTALTVAAAPAILPGDTNRDGVVDDAHDKVFAAVGATGDALGLFDEYAFFMPSDKCA